MQQRRDGSRMTQAPEQAPNKGHGGRRGGATRAHRTSWARVPSSSKFFAGQRAILDALHVPELYWTPPEMSLCAIVNQYALLLAGVLAAAVHRAAPPAARL